MKKEMRAMMKELIEEQNGEIQLLVTSNSKLIYESIDKLRSSMESLSTKVSGMEKIQQEHETKITEIERSLDFTQDLLDTKISEINKDWDRKLQMEIGNLNRCVFLAKQEADYFKDKLRILEDRNRRNNLRIDGINENLNETWEESEKKVKDLIRDTMKIEENICIERAHRVGRKDQGKTRPIIFKLQNWKQKELILKNSSKLKNSGFYINEDFSDETVQIRKNLFKEMKHKREQGKFAKVVYDKLVVRDFRPRY